MNNSTQENTIQQSMNLDIDEPIPKMFRSNESFCELIRRFDCNAEFSDGLKEFTKGLLSIKPTSTEAERCFSSAGWIISNRRTRMKAELVNSIVLCHSFYKK